MGLKGNYSITAMKQAALVSDEKLNEGFLAFHDQQLYIFAGSMCKGC